MVIGMRGNFLDGLGWQSWGGEREKERDNSGLTKEKAIIYKSHIYQE